jgi:hypothetical protein
MTAVLPDAQQTFHVTPSHGHPMEVLSQQEVAFYERQRDGYTRENTFTETSDAADLDRLLALELQLFRIERFLISGCDYDNHPVSASAATDMRRQQRYLSAMITEIKDSLGLSRSARDRAQAESVGGYLVELRKRAKEFGVKRNTEMFKALTLVHELIALVETYDRCNDHERAKLGLDGPEDFLEWLRSKFIPEFREIDVEFRKTSQSYWVGRL